MKKSIVFYLGILFSFFCLNITAKAQTSKWDGHSSSTSWYNPNESIYYIQSAADLCGLSHLLMPGSYIDFTGKEVILMADIDLGNYEWETIGRIEDSYYYTFKGTFNGNGKTISGLKISALNNGNTKTIGLFGVLMEPNAIIKNLIIEGNIDLPCNSLYGASIGGITGLSYATIYNCISKVNIKVSNINSSGIYIGSVIGNNYNVIRNCQASGNIRISQDAISKCRLGGIAGNSATGNSTISICKSETNITVIDGKEAIIGGISGFITGRNSNNLFSGNIDANDCYIVYAGGIMPMGDTADNCLMLGTFSGYGKYYYKGAIIPTTGENAITNCYYKQGTPNSSGIGTTVDDNTLKNGNPLPGFNTSIWNFSYEKYPDLHFKFEEEIEMPTIQSIILNKDNLTMNIGDTEKLYATTYPSGITSSFIWTSSNENVASVSSEGLVVAKEEGSTYITVKTSNNISTTCRVEVINNSTANENIQTNKIKLIGNEESITITSNIPIEALIYTINGILVEKCNLTIGTNEIPVKKGIYVIKTELGAQKVIVH